jgi:CMP-N,N'-diacetyllegionaminic acid synthase
MRLLALIAARGGSKRLPGKNIRMLGGKPLIVWSIDVAKNTAGICDILVSTDDIAIATVSAEAGALVPWLRPAELATDTSSAVDVAIHALDWYEAARGKVDGLLLLQPTSPFRTLSNVQKGVELFQDNARQTVLGVSPSSTHPMWTFKLDGGYLVPYMDNHGLGMRSQDLEPVYEINGSFYLISPSDLRSTRSFVGKNSIPLLIDSNTESLDIDTESDFNLANSLILNSPN